MCFARSLKHWQEPIDLWDQIRFCYNNDVFLAAITNQRRWWCRLFWRNTLLLARMPNNGILYIYVQCFYKKIAVSRCNTNTRVKFNNYYRFHTLTTKGFIYFVQYCITSGGSQLKFVRSTSDIGEQHTRSTVSFSLLFFLLLLIVR